jgi:pilus assembly protein CpaC
MRTLLSGFVVPLLLLIQPVVPISTPAKAFAPASPVVVPTTRALDQALPASAINVLVNGSTVLDHPAGIRRISVANGEIAEAIAVSSTEVVINGKLPGETSLIVWDQKGSRLMFDVRVTADSAKQDAVLAQLLKEAGPDASIKVQDGIVFLNGTVKDTTAADRAFTIASTLGKVVNLLRVSTPAGDPQILLKVRFADVDRSASSQLGVNLFSFDPSKQLATSTTGGFGSLPTFNYSPGSAPFSVSSLLNLFYYRPDINLGAIIQDLATKNVLQILAEPNLLTMSGRPANFLAGGEFPFPTLQGGGSGVGQITIQFKEFGIKLNFLPTVTPRGTIHLAVTPEVSSLDFANSLSVSGFVVPGLATRRVQTEVELESGQSFVIAGLLNNQVTENLSKMPGLANIPLFGKLFQSRTLNKNNSELLVMVTPELVRPLPANVKPPEVLAPVPFLKDAPTSAPQQPGGDVTGAAALVWKRESLPIEELKTPPQAGISAESAVSVTAPGAPAGIPAPPAPTVPPAAGASVQAHPLALNNK